MEIHTVVNAVLVIVRSRDPIHWRSIETMKRCSGPITQIKIRAECMPTSIECRINDKRESVREELSTDRLDATNSSAPLNTRGKTHSTSTLRSSRHPRQRCRRIRAISDRFGDFCRRDSCTVTGQPPLQTIEVRFGAFHPVEIASTCLMQLATKVDTYHPGLTQILVGRMLGLI
jgi:hypothetical protein